MAKKNIIDSIYEERFGMIPNDQPSRVRYILGKKANDEKYLKEVELRVKQIKRIKYKKVTFTLWKIMRPSARPRANTRHGYVKMYVPHAKEEGDWFEQFAKDNHLPEINTPCILNIKIYEKTPSNFNRMNTVLAELGYIRPWKRTGDFDNYAKAVADAIQHGMLKDDCLVFKSSQELLYSIKPHAEIEIIYMSSFPEL